MELQLNSLTHQPAASLHFTSLHSTELPTTDFSHQPATSLHPTELLTVPTPESESESESELLYYWRFTANHFVLAINPLRPTNRNFIVQLNTCGYSPYVTSSLMRGWICRLQLLLVLASAVILRSESRGTHAHILLS
jgi:hypothetical protein